MNDYRLRFMRLKFLPSVLLSIFLSLMSMVVVAADEINIKDNQALHGYDPVTYFSDKPMKGDQAILSLYKQVEYHFTSLQNKTIFERSPERYLPMYGGYCAYGVRMGKKLDIDPFAYEIRDGRLYVLLNRATHKMWQQDMEKNIQVSDQTWPEIKAKSIESLN